MLHCSMLFITPLVITADLECCVNVISHLVPRLPPHQVRTAAKQVADALVATVSLHLLNCLLLHPSNIATSCAASG